jgi:hypothetical protein
MYKNEFFFYYTVLCFTPPEVQSCKLFIFRQSYTEFLSSPKSFSHDNVNIYKFHALSNILFDTFNIVLVRRS